MQVYRVTSQSKQVRISSSPIFLKLCLALAGCLLLAACQPYQYRGTVLTEPKTLQDFTLSASDGSEFTLSASDKLLLLYFGYTHCVDVCPTTLAHLKIAIQKLGDKASSVQVAFITVDPERDTAEQLAGYLGNFDPSFIGLRATDVPLLQSIVKDFGIYYESESHDAHDSEYLVAHTSTILVVKNAKLLAVIPDDASSDEIASDVEHLLSR